MNTEKNTEQLKFRVGDIVRDHHRGAGEITEIIYQSPLKDRDGKERRIPAYICVRFHERFETHIIKYAVPDSFTCGMLTME